MKCNNVKPLVIAACLSFSLMACSNETTQNGQAGTSTSTANTTDANMATDREQDFVMDVMEENTEEMAWLRAGIARGTDAELKSHAQQMLTDHEQMGREMSDYAGQKNITARNVDTTGIVRINDDIGVEWDEEWADEVADMHEDLIRKFERAQDRVQDATLRDMIVRTLPTLRSHYEMAEALEKRLDDQRK